MKSGYFPAWVFLLGYFPPIWMLGLVLIPAGDFLSQMASFGIGGNEHSTAEIMNWPGTLYREQKRTNLQRRIDRLNDQMRRSR